jgi:competence protein ComGC
MEVANSQPADTRIPPAPSRPPVAKPRRRWPTRVALLILIGLLFLAVPFLGYFYISWKADREMDAVIAEIERGDPHWRFNDMIADRKPIADADNPALVCGKVDALLRRNGANGYNLSENQWRLFDNMSSVHLLNDAQTAILRETLNKHTEAVKLGRTLKDYPGEGRFAINYTASFISINLDPLQHTRTVMTMLQHDAMLRAEDGDQAGALESSQAILVAARAIGEEPYLIAALIRYAGEAIAVNALERTLAQCDAVPADQLKNLQELLAKEIDAPVLAQAMRGERGGFDGMIAELKDGNVRLSAIIGRPTGSGNLEDWLIDTFPGVMLAGRPEYLRLMTQAVEAAKLPPEQQAEAFKEVEQATRKSNAVVVRLLMPAVSKVSDANRRTRANMRCAMVGIAAERYRLAHEEWPASLDELVKKGWIASVPLDPYDGQPLRYKLRHDGVTVYSVGPDGVDNGGNINRDRPFESGTDQGFLLWDVGARRQPPLPEPPGDDGGPR